MKDAVIAMVLFAAGTFSVIAALMVNALARNHPNDPLLAWRRLFGPFLSIGNGARGLRLQVATVKIITLMLFVASGFFALRALFSG